VVAFAGSKGGTGKTTFSHLVAHGAGSLPHPIPAVVVTTDPEDTLAVGDRRYVVVDGRSPALLADQIHRLLGIERLLVVVDGVANRADVDRVLAEIADLVVIPYGPSAQDGARAAANLDGLPTAVAMPNRWPAHPGVAKRARRWLEAVPALPAVAAGRLQRRSGAALRRMAAEGGAPGKPERSYPPLGRDRLVGRGCRSHSVRPLTRGARG